ncbi:MAG: BON domain-containing protein [Oxalobacteraceae bacterium]|nr:BON domain-containing protein [Oxalobacteraceae bacterium]
MQNPKMLSRLLAAAVLSLASVAAVSVQAADVAADAATNAASPTSAPGASAADTGASGPMGAAEDTGVSGAVGATSAYADDAMITTMVKTALIEDKQVKSLKISVTTEQGVVKMSGTVPNAEVGNRALQLATTVQGVKGVKNDLKVKG